MVTCFLRYVIDPDKIREFEACAKLWIPIVKRMGGTHHGYFLPHEGANNIAFALFSFPSLAAYEEYRTKVQSDPESQRAQQVAADARCILSYERHFMRPVLE
ncbi:MAG: NIPSNAP family protein [Alphaproteobacteria bacterium]|nr:NIPSNAP family protein [Alphaproteobacteria bacterium]